MLMVWRRWIIMRYIFCMCVCVCFPGAFCIPVYIPYNLTGRWMLGKGLCKVWLVMDYLLCSASVFNIVLISYDRFLSVTRAVSTACEDAHYYTLARPQTHTHIRVTFSSKKVSFPSQREILVQDVTDFPSFLQRFLYFLFPIWVHVSTCFFTRWLCN